MNTHTSNYLFCRFLVWACLFFPLTSIGAPYIGELEATPDTFTVQETNVVTFTVQVDNSDPSLITSSAKLVRYNLKNQAIGRPISLFDDGTNGDAIPGDGIYTGQLTINEPSADLMLFKASFAYKGSLKRVMSDYVEIHVVTELSQQDAETALSIPAQAYAQYQSRISSGLTPADAQNETITWLQQQPGVDQAGTSDGGGLGIWISYTSGMLGGILLNPPGTKGGSISPSIASASTLNVVENAKAVAIRLHDFVKDEAITVPPLLKNNIPPIETNYYPVGSGTLDVLKTLDNYGTIIISSHGGTLYDAYVNKNNSYQWKHIENGQVVIATSHKLDKTNIEKYKLDLKSGRLAAIAIENRDLSQSVYLAFLPEFVSHYFHKMPNSIVYVSACWSAANDSMSNAFLGAGAKTYFGYTGDVLPNHAADRGTALFKMMTTVDDLTGLVSTTGEAYDCQSCSNSLFSIKGDTNTVLPNNLVANGSFETGGFKFWNKVGNYVAAIPVNATDGNFALRLGRADGGPEPIGWNSVYQDIDIPTVSDPAVLPGGAKLALRFNVRAQGDKNPGFNSYPIIAIAGWFTAYIEDLTGSQGIDGYPIASYSPGVYEGNGSSVSPQLVVSADVTPFMGTKMRLSLSLHHDGFPEIRTTAYVDDVHFDVCSDQPGSGLDSCNFSPLP